jgi:D-alanyl-D-alanine carboxypeptidase
MGMDIGRVTRAQRGERGATAPQRLLVAVMALVLAACTTASPSPASTLNAGSQPSMRQFSAWLDAFNSGDRERYASFLEDAFPARSRSLNDEMLFREATGGFDLRKVEEASATKVSGLVQERGSDQFARFELIVAATDGHQILALTLDAIPRPSEFPIARLSEAEVVDGVDAVIRQRVAEDQFSGTVLIARDGQTIFEEAHGLADRERGIPNEITTRFRIGSMNKMFTAVATLQLAEAGALDLSAPIGRYLPDYPNREIATKVTIHQLLNHTGGTGDIFGPAFDAHRLELRTLDDYVAQYGDRGPRFEPGSRWEYSNYGFVLLGVVIEAVTGQSYYDYVQAHIYDPAGMTSTGSLPEEENVPDRSVGYTRQAGSTAWVPNTDTLPYRGTSAGGGYSTVEDLARFADALLGNVLLSSGYTQLLITAKTDVDPEASYAYGFEDLRGASGTGFVGHGGGAPGMNGDLRIYPASGYVVVVLANLDPPAAGNVADYLDYRLPLEGS